MGLIALASASALYCSTEASWGTTAPATNWRTARITSMDLRARQTNTTSNELSTSREPAAQIRTDRSADGSINFEGHVDTGAPATAPTPLEMFLASCFGNTWTADVAVSGSIQVLTASGTHWSSSALFTSISVGDWVKAAGFVSASNNGVFYVSAKASASDITVLNPAAVAAAGAAATISSSRLSFGSTLLGISMEQKVATATPLYEQFTGMVARSVSLNIATGAILTGQAQFTGIGSVQSTTSISGTPAAQGTATVLNPIDHVLAIYEGTMGTAETWKTGSITLTISSPLNPLFALQSLGAVGIRVGRPTVSATANIYVEHAGESDGVKDLIDAYNAGTERTGFAFRIGTSTGSSYVFQFNRYLITNNGIPVGGNESDMIMPMEIAATVDPTILKAFSVFKV